MDYSPEASVGFHSLVVRYITRGGCSFNTDYDENSRFCW